MLKSTALKTVTSADQLIATVLSPSSFSSEAEKNLNRVRVELAKFKALEGKTWNHPVLIGDRLYIRNAEQAACWRLPLVN